MNGKISPRVQTEQKPQQKHHETTILKRYFPEYISLS
jgi:hypothetical protein